MSRRKPELQKTRLVAAMRTIHDEIEHGNYTRYTNPNRGELKEALWVLTRALMRNRKRSVWTS
jgi:hypothetical protein